MSPVYDLFKKAKGAAVLYRVRWTKKVKKMPSFKQNIDFPPFFVQRTMHNTLQGA
jgi:hypothetical protein